MLFRSGRVRPLYLVRLLLTIAPRLNEGLAKKEVEKKEESDQIKGTNAAVETLVEEIRKMRIRMDSLQAGARQPTVPMNHGTAGGFLGNCLYCDKPGHSKNFCRDMKEAEERGWIKVVDGFVTVADISLVTPVPTTQPQ